MTPEEALALTKSIADIYSDATTRLLTLIGKSLATGGNTPRWAEERLAELLTLRRRAQGIVTEMQAASQAEALTVLSKAYAGGRLSPLSNPGLVGTHTRAVEQLASELNRVTTSGSTQILRWTDDVYRRTVADTVAAGVTGVAGRQAVTAQILDRFATIGVSGFRDLAGRNWTLESYAEMAARTAVGRAHQAGTIDRIEAAGGDIVIVSDSPEECRRCRPFEGTLLSLSGAPSGPDLDAAVGSGFTYMGSLDEARGRGLFHPNCTHRIDRYVPGLTEPFTRNTANPKGDELRQRQRALERAVRESKRRILAVQPLGNTPTLRVQQSLLRARQARLNQFISDNDRKQWVSTQRTSVDPRFSTPPPTQPLPVPPSGPLRPSTQLRRPTVQVIPQGAPPVSNALKVGNMGGLTTPVNIAMEAIDTVHGDGALPDLPVKFSTAKSFMGQYASRGTRPVDLRVSTSGLTPALTTVHEVGHFLDHQGLGTPGVFATTDASLTTLDAWKQAVAGSDAVRTLRAVDPSLYGAHAASIASHVVYLTEAEELWGRSYAQYVATRSGDPTLLAELDAMIEMGRTNGLPRQWEHGDFEQIARAIDDVLRRRGWQS